MIVIVGESASGKSSVEKYLIEQFGYEKVISYTTREKRENEIDGVDYHFVNMSKFEEMYNSDVFLETAIYNNWCYGSLIQDYYKNSEKKIAVLTPHGLRQLKKYSGINVNSIYISIPRRERLIKILERGDDIEESYRRNLSDVGQFDGIEDEVDLIIDNSGYKKSIKDIASIIHTYFTTCK
jgi:guanylate kinase